MHQMLGNTEEGTEPVRKGTGMPLGAGDSCPEQEFLIGMNPAEKRGNSAGSRFYTSKGKKTQVPLAFPGTPRQYGRLEYEAWR